MSWKTSLRRVGRGRNRGMTVYGCKSCGGEIVVDETTAATACPFCDNPVVIMGRFKGTLRPNYIIPFKLDKNSKRGTI